MWEKGTPTWVRMGEGYPGVLPMQVRPGQGKGLDVDGGTVNSTDNDTSTCVYEPLATKKKLNYRSLSIPTTCFVYMQYVRLLLLWKPRYSKIKRTASI